MEQRSHLGQIVIFTTGEVAAICGVAHGTVRSWCEALLKNYRMPESWHRRIKREDLIVFMAGHGIPSRRRDLLQDSRV